jgi:CheY-like chemotaxis protein
MGERRTIILCVDDEEIPLVLRRLVLQKAGYEVLSAHSGSEALEITRSQTVDLVLSDHLMPGMTGVELAGQVKAGYPDLPFVLISGVNEIPAGAALADAFLSKLIGPDMLCRELSAILKRGEEGS